MGARGDGHNQSGVTMANMLTTLTYNTANSGSFTYGGSIAFGVGSASLVNVPPYSTVDPTITHTAGILMDSLVSFTPAVVAAGNDAVKYLLNIDGADTYWDGTDWVASNGTYAQSNTAAEIDDNAAALDLTDGKTVKVVVFLHSDNGTTTPSISSIAIVHGFAVAAPTAPAECVVFGFVFDHTGAPVQGAKVKVTNAAYFHHSNYYVKAHVAEVVTDADGYWELDLIETETVRKYYSVDITYTTGGAARTDKFPVIIVPNTASANFSTLV